MSELRNRIKESLFNGKCNLSPLVCGFPNELTIDEIPVYIKLQYCKGNGCIWIILYNINLLSYTELEDYDDFNLIDNSHLVTIDSNKPVNELVDDVISNLQNRIQNLRFDIFLGKFVDITCKLSLLKKDVNELFKDMAHVKPRLRRSDHCCVCFEDTVTKTHCGHCVCIRCAVNIQQTKVLVTECDDDFEDEYELLCPVCRKELLF